MKNSWRMMNNSRDEFQEDIKETKKDYSQRKRRSI